MDRPWLALGLIILIAPPFPVAPAPVPAAPPGAAAPVMDGAAPERGPGGAVQAARALPAPGFIENAGQLSDGSIRLYSIRPFPAAFTATGVIFAGHRMDFSGARPVRPLGLGPAPGVSNFLLGNDPSRWRTGVATFGELLYPGLYDGIDLCFRIQDGKLKYEFLVAAGADPAAIALRFEGATPVLDGNDIVLDTPAGRVRDGSFFAYQGAGAGRSAVEARTVVAGQYVKYDLGAYDRSRPLVIDPLISSTVLGGTGDEYAIATAVDRFDQGYVAGETLSADFPATGSAYSNRPAGPNSTFDLFVTKLAPDGKRTLFSTYIGSSGNDFVHDLRLDGAGFVYLTGYTFGFDFPTTNGSFDRGYNGYGDAFALKLVPAGTRLTFSTFLGGDDVDFGYALALGEDGSAYIGGGTVSIDFPSTAGAFQTSIKTGTAMQDAFVLKLAPDGSALRYCTYLGGEGSDYVLGIRADQEGNALVTGATASGDFPTTEGAFSRVNHDQDAFVAKLDPAGSSLVYSTFFGGLGTDVGNVLELDGSGGCLVAGDTTSYNLPVTEHPAAGRYRGFRDCFAARFDGTGRELTFCGYFGGSQDDSASAVLLDAGGNLTVAGTTLSADLATTPAAEQRAQPGRRDLFAVRLDAQARYVLYQGYFGGGGDDSCAGAALDAAGLLCLAGTTSSSDLPGAPGTARNGTDVFLVRLAPLCVPGPPGLRLSTGNHTVALEWTEPGMGAGGLQGYMLYRGNLSTELGISWRLPAEVGDFQDSGLENGVNYYYALSAVNASGEGERSSLRVAMPGLPPSPPQNLTAAGRPSKVVLSWQPPVHAYDMPLLKYRLFRWTAGNPARLVAEVANATAYNDTAVYNGFTYFYDVRAVNIIGEGAPSGESAAVPSERPSPPRNLRAYLDGRAVTLSWDLPDNPGIGSIEDYFVYHCLDDGRQRLAGRTPVMLYVDRDLLAGTYRYRVVANSTVGEGYPTEELVVNITNLPPLAGYTVDRLESTTGRPFAFTSTSSDRDTYIVNYTWDFGDGGRSFKQDPTHYYARRGVYNVTLRVRDVDGAQAAAGGMVSVLNTPPSIGAFSPGPSTVVSRGRSREFSITPLDPDQDTLATVWSVNGSVAGTGHRVRITFNLTGSYVLTATLSDGEASARTSWNVTVEPEPPPGPGHFPWYWLLGASLAAAGAVTGIVLFRRRASPPAPAPKVSPRSAPGRTKRTAIPRDGRLKRPPQKDIIRKRYS